MTINDVIELIDSVPEGTIVGDGASRNFYITGTVDAGSIFDSGWKFSMTDTDGTVSCEHEAFLYSGVSNQSGAFDGFVFLMQAKFQKTDSSYKLIDASIDRDWHPAATKISIDNEISVKVPLTAQITINVVPANATLEGSQWHSDEEGIATVEQQSGKVYVKGVSAGTAHITLTIGKVTSNKCTVTVTAAEANKIEFDWSAGIPEDIVVDSKYTASASANMMTKLNTWSPSQEEITAFTTTNCKTSRSYAGIAYSYLLYDNTATINLTTTHQIKKVTLKIVPFSNATTTQFSINDVPFSKDKAGDATYDGKIGSAFEAEIELTSPSNELAFRSVWTEGNNFVIVGITFEW